MVAGFQPGENQNPLPRAAGRFDHHPPLAAPGGPAPLGWNNPPTPRWNASESASIVRRCPHDIRSTQTKGRHPCGGNGLKSTLRGFSNGLSLRQSRSRRSHSIRQSAAEPAGRSPEVKKHGQPGGKNQYPPQCPSSSIPRRQSPAGTHWGRIVSDAAPEGMR